MFVLGAVLLGLTLALALAGMATSHLGFAANLGNAAKARNYAESAVALAVAELLQNPRLGDPRLFTYETAEGSGRLTFDDDLATRYGLPLSRNNLVDDGARAGTPPGTARLVAQGFCNGTYRIVDVLVRMGEPDVMSSSGPIATEGPVLVARAGDLGGLTLPFDPGGLLPGTIGSNSEDEQAVLLGEGALVTGDAQAAGGIEVLPGAEVWGRTRPNSGLRELPDVDVAALDPELQGRPGVAVLQAPTLQSEVLSGFYVRRGGLTVENQLELAGGVLFVEGDLVVKQGLRGQGAVIATGTVTMEGGVQLDTDNRVAIVAGADVSLTGDGTFTGMIYTEGDFTAERITVIGTFVANSESGSQVSLIESQAVSFEGSSAIEFPVGTAGPTTYFAGQQLASPRMGATLGVGMGDAKRRAERAEGWYQVKGMQINGSSNRAGAISVQVHSPTLAYRIEFIEPGFRGVIEPVEENGNLVFYLPDGSLLGTMTGTVEPHPLAGAPAGEAGEEDTWRLDLKEFVAPRELVEVVWWQERAE